MDTKTTPRDSFLYLLALITLIASAISFGVLAYDLIDIRFPDALQYVSTNYQSIRIALASLVVVFPVFVLTSWFLRRDVVKHAEKQDLKIRRWLMYFTVFVAALVIIGDLVTLIYNFLQGDLTTQFIFKVITIFFIAGTSLFYYLAELRNTKYQRRNFAWIIIGLIAIIAVYGFYLAGSPQNQRLMRFDDQKISDLQMIQDRIIYYWQQKGMLPATLSNLNDSISGFSVPSDPQSNQDFGYRIMSPRSFQLCADFNRPTDTSGGSNVVYPAGTNWQHGAGQVCFDRTIDQTLYPVNSGVPKVPPVR